MRKFPFRRPSDKISGPWLIYNGHSTEIVQGEATEARAQGACNTLNNHEERCGHPRTHRYEYDAAYDENSPL